jgi:hypothetical protein
MSSIVNPKDVLVVLEKNFPTMVNRSFFNEDDVVSLFCKSKTGGMATGFDILDASIMMVSLLAGIIICEDIDERVLADDLEGFGLR